MQIGPYTVKAMPSTPMTEEEIARQLAVVSSVAEAYDYFMEDELEQASKR